MLAVTSEAVDNNPWQGRWHDDRPVMMLPKLVAAEPVWRRPGELQVSTAHGPLVLAPVPPGLLLAVDLFDGRHHYQDLIDLVGRAWGDWLLAALTDQDAFAAEVTPCPTWLVQGNGPLARRLTLSLRRLVAQPDRSTTQADLVILADGMVETDRIVADRLAAANQPHLVVLANQTTAQVGPFVLPASTSCLSCLDRARQALDPAWGLMVFQRMRLASTPDPVLAGWAVATAVAHVRAWSQGLVPESAGTTLTLDRTGVVTYTAWRRHPDCPHHSVASAGVG